MRGNVLVHGLWDKLTGCVLDTPLTDTDARSYAQLSSSQVLQTAENVKKDKNLDPCLARRKGFIPLVYSVDGMTGKEAKSFERRIAGALPHFLRQSGTAPTERWWAVCVDVWG